jgi:signal transduction histidine kinase
MSTPGRTFVPEDVAVAEDLGRRAGVALDHARLFRRLEIGTRELDAVIGSISDGVIVASADGTIRSRNAAADRILGSDPPGDLSGVLGRLRPDEGAPEVLRSPETGRAMRVTTTDLEVDGERSRIVLLRDVTDILDTEAARNAFIGMLSHELRTPVTMIYGSATVLQREGGGPERDELITDLVEESDRLYRLVEDLLVLSRFERGALDFAPEPVLVQRILPPIARLEERRSPGFTVEFDFEGDLPAVEGDEIYLGQVIRNLLGNAAKYGGVPGSVMVRGRADGSRVVIEVEDHGPGIPAGQEERIFELYERTTTARRSGLPGAGVGLFVSRRLVELMRGTISAGAAPGGGARLTVSLPVYDADGTERAVSGAVQ